MAKRPTNRPPASPPPSAAPRAADQRHQRQPAGTRPPRSSYAAFEPWTWSGADRALKKKPSPPVRVCVPAVWPRVRCTGPCALVSRDSLTAVRDINTETCTKPTLSSPSHFRPVPGPLQFGGSGGMPVKEEEIGSSPHGWHPRRPTDLQNPCKV